MKAFFKTIASFFVAIWEWICNLIADISTFLREGDKTSSFSSKRICAIGLIVAGIKLLYVGMSVFQNILDKGWYAVFIFIPAVLCFAFAAFFFYINGKIDIASALDKTKEIVGELKKEH